LIDDGEVDRCGTGRRDRDPEADYPDWLGGTTRADSDQNERDGEDREREGREYLARVEHTVRSFIVFMVSDMGAVLLVACSGLCVMLGWNRPDTEGGRSNRQNERKSEDETVRADQWRWGFSGRQEEDLAGPDVPKRRYGRRARRPAAPVCIRICYGMFGHSVG
jgi:hypothetical protein